MPKSTRQIRLDPEVEDAVQRIAEQESRTFSSTCNWLLKLASARYLDKHGSENG